MRNSALAAVVLVIASASAVADEIELVSGEVLQATVLERDDAGVLIEHEILGRLWVRTEHLRAIDGAPVAKPTAPPRAPEPAKAPAKPAEEPESAWTWKAEVGLSGSEGNSDTADLHSAISGLLEDDAKRWQLGASYDYAETAGAKSKDRFHAAARRDWKLPDSDWFLFAGAAFDLDDFQDYDNRWSLSGGAGYQWIDRDDLNVRFRGGLNYVQENGLQSDADDSRTEALAGGELRWQISDTQALELATTLFPDLDDGAEYRLDTTIGWSIKLDTMENMHFKLGATHEYDSHRSDPFETGDLTYFAALAWEF